jgi:hypothetical protein
MKERVVVWGEQVEVEVHQSSKTVWIARGEYKGKYHEAKGSSARAAAKWWADAAKYHSN